jgi:ABC-type polysaccharide/polyol phosphate transport system ATPase subunit
MLLQDKELMNSENINDSYAIIAHEISKAYKLHNTINNETGEISKELLVLNNVSFKIRSGEHVGIVGRNGSGKSTLLKILAGITLPSSGKIEINGRIASVLDVGAGFHPELSGRENVYLNGHILGFSKNEIDDKFQAMVDFSEIENFIEEPVKNYSSGMYLRLAFGIITQLDFDIYLFDEVINVGDINFQIKIQNFFRDKLKSKTLIVVSHNYSSMMKITDRIIGLKDGKVNFLENNLESISNLVKNQEANVAKEIHLTGLTLIVNKPQYEFIFNKGKIEIEFEIQCDKNRKCDIILKISNAVGDNLAGDSVLFRDKITNNYFESDSRYLIKFSLEKHFLSIGTYYVRFLIGNGIDLLEETDNLIKIIIQENQNIAYNNVLSKINAGIVSHQFDWQIIKK